MIVLTGHYHYMLFSVIKVYSLLDPFDYSGAYFVVSVLKDANMKAYFNITFFFLWNNTCRKHSDQMQI